MPAGCLAARARWFSKCFDLNPRARANVEDIDVVIKLMGNIHLGRVLPASEDY